MARKKAKFVPTQAEIELLERLRRQPRMQEGLVPLLDLAEEVEGSMDAHEMEEKLIERIQEMGLKTATSWTENVQDHESAKARQSEPRLRSREKKNSDGPPSSGQSRS